MVEEKIDENVDSWRYESRRDASERSRPPTYYQLPLSPSLG